MIFKVKMTEDFRKQFSKLDIKSKQLIKNKAKLIEINPFKYKNLRIKNRKVFRVRLNIQNKDMSLVYELIAPDIILLCLLERKHDYKEIQDLHK